MALLAPATHALDLVSAPLSGGGFACSALNASPNMLVISLDIRDGGGMSKIGGPGTLTVAPGATINAGYGFGGTHQAYCTISSPAAKKGDIKLGFCATDADAMCIAAVSTE
jgi:hypothetical protein